MMKIALTVVLFVVVGLIIAGNYFYNVAINRAQEGPELHGGGSSVAAASLLDTDEHQAKMDELMKWTDKQNFEIVEITSYDGLKLKARFLKNENSGGKAVILAHGYKGNSTQMQGITKFYYDQGFDILKPDARGHGQSQGKYIGYGWHDRKDYVNWVQFLINNKNNHSIFLHGFSMGASTVLMASGEELPDEVKGIIGDSGYTSVKDVLSHQLKYLYNLPPFPIMEVTSFVTKVRAGYTFGEASTIEAVKRTKLPLFIIHGDIDELVPTVMANELYNAAKGEIELWIVAGAGHTEAYTVAEKE